MASNILFTNWDEQRCYLLRENVRDLADLFIRFDNKTIYFHGYMREDRLKNKKKMTLGLHSYDPLFDRHDIYIDPQKIEFCFGSKMRTGGNRIAPDIHIAVGMVLAHEMQHANQYIHHNGQLSFFGKKKSKYKTRPCEREARSFADENVQVIANVLGISISKEKLIDVPQDELSLIADCLSESDEVTVTDIVDELRQSGLNNAVNVMKVKSLLQNFTS